MAYDWGALVRAQVSGRVNENDGDEVSSILKSCVRRIDDFCCPHGFGCVHGFGCAR